MIRAFQLLFLWSTVTLALAEDTHAPSVKYYVQLVWGTNREKPEEANFKPVGPRLQKQLSQVFQWERYWEVNCRTVTVQKGKASRLRLSKDCEIEIDLISPTVRETRIFGKGVLVTKSQRKIKSKGFSIHGGAIEVGGSWFVVIREDEPKYNSH